MDTVHIENKLQQYSIRKSKLEKKGVKILESNPCFEIWFLLHFDYTTKLFDSCDAVTRELRKRPELNDYNKSQEYHGKKNLYRELKDRLCNQAIPNAKKLDSESLGLSANCPRSQIFEFMETFRICKNNGK